MNSPRLFLLACQYPGGLLDRVSAEARSAQWHGPSQRARVRLRALCRPGDGLVFTGDQIYADATAGLFDMAAQTHGLDGMWATAQDPVLALPREGVAHVSLMDDHEIGDNWEPSAHAQRQTRLQAALDTGRAAFLAHTRGGDTPAPQGDAACPLWGIEQVAGAAVFVGDTRTERSLREPARIAEARIMSRAQREAMEQYLRERPAGLPRVVITPSLLLPRRLSTAEPATGDLPARAAQALRSDAWDGYPACLQRLLAFVVDHGLDHCVFLSGDEHLAGGAVVDVTRDDGRRVRLWSVHAGAMYAPWPFGNAVAEDFALDDQFAFDRVPDAPADGTPTAHRRPHRYSVQVRARFAPAGDGVMSVGLDGVADGRAPQVVFHFADGGDWHWGESDVPSGHDGSGEAATPPAAASRSALSSV